MSEPDNLVRLAAHAVYEQLKGHFWTDGGFLCGVGEGADKVIVMVERKLYPHESRLVPKEQDGVPVEVSVTGIPRMC